MRHRGTREVAAFIGNMNFFDAKVTGNNGGQTSVDGGGLGKLSAPSGAMQFSNGDKVVVAIRPEKFSLSDAKPAGRTNAVKGRLDNAAYLGERSHFYVSVAGLDKPVAVSAQNIQRKLDGFDHEQRDVWLSWPDDAIVMLGAD